MARPAAGVAAQAGPRCFKAPGGACAGRRSSRSPGGRCSGGLGASRSLLRTAAAVGLTHLDRDGAAVAAGPDAVTRAPIRRAAIRPAVAVTVIRVRRNMANSSLFGPAPPSNIVALRARSITESRTNGGCPQPRTADRARSDRPLTPRSLHSLGRGRGGCAAQPSCAIGAAGGRDGRLCRSCQADQHGCVDPGTTDDRQHTSATPERQTVGSVIKKRRKRMAKKKHRKLLKKTRIQRRRQGK